MKLKQEVIFFKLNLYKKYKNLGGTRMRDLVEAMIEKLDYFEIECEELKKDAYDELDRNEFADNQYLWATIRRMAELLEQYTA